MSSSSCFRLACAAAVLSLALLAAHAQDPTPSGIPQEQVSNEDILKEMRNALGKGEAGVALFRRHLGNEDPEIRAAAVQLLGMEAKDGAVDDLLPLTEDDSDLVVLAATKELLGMDDPRVVTAIRKVLTSTTPGIRAELASYLGEVKDDRFLAEMGQYFSHKDLKLRRITAEALRAIGSGKAFPYCMAATNDKDQRVASSAIGCLEVLGNPKALPRLAILADSPDVSIRAATARCIPILGGASSYTWKLEKLIQDPEPVVRSSLLKGLELHPDAAGLKFLEKLISHPEARIRHLSAAPLGANPDPKAGQLLERMLKDEVEMVRVSAVRGLGRRDDENGWKVIARGAGDPSPNVRLTVVLMLGMIGDEASFPTLERLASDRDESVRIAALNQAAVMGGARALPLLEKALEGGRKADRAEAIRGLCEIDDPGSHALLRSVASGGDPSERVTAIRALGRMGDPEALPILEKAREDPVEKVRTAAREAVRQLKAR